MLFCLKSVHKGGRQRNIAYLIEGLGWSNESQFHNNSPQKKKDYWSLKFHCKTSWTQLQLAQKSDFSETGKTSRYKQFTLSVFWLLFFRELQKSKIAQKEEVVEESLGDKKELEEHDKAA